MKKHLNYNEIYDLKENFNSIKNLKKVSATKEYKEMLDMKLETVQAMEILGKVPANLFHVYKDITYNYLNKDNILDRYKSCEMDIEDALSFRNSFVNNMSDNIIGEVLQQIDFILIENLYKKGVIDSCTYKDINEYATTDYKSKEDRELEEYNASYYSNEFNDTASFEAFLIYLLGKLTDCDIHSVWYSNLFPCELEEGFEVDPLFQSYADEVSHYEECCEDEIGGDMLILCIEGLEMDVAKLDKYLDVVTELESRCYIKNGNTYFDITSHQLEYGIDVAFFIELIYTYLVNKNREM